MTLPCCTIDGEYFQPFKLEGEEAERWISPAGPGPQAHRVPGAAGQPARAAMAAHRDRTSAPLPGVKSARVNLTGRRVAVVYAEGEIEPQALIDRLGVLGYMAAALRPARDRPAPRTTARPAAAPGPGRGGLRRRQRHAALGLRLVGGRGRDARSLPLALGDDRAAGRRLCGASLLLFGRQCAAAGPRQHGRADLAGRAARLAS